MKKKIILLVTDIVIAALILLGVWIINYKIRRMRLIKQILFHTAVICGLVCLTAKILDWYNPFMDFFWTCVVYPSERMCVSAGSWNFKYCGDLQEESGSSAESKRQLLDCRSQIAR